MIASIREAVDLFLLEEALHSRLLLLNSRLSSLASDSLCQDARALCTKQGGGGEMPNLLSKRVVPKRPKLSTCHSIRIALDQENMLSLAGRTKLQLSWEPKRLATPPQSHPRCLPSSSLTPPSPGDQGRPGSPGVGCPWATPRLHRIETPCPCKARARVASSSGATSSSSMP